MQTLNLRNNMAHNWVLHIYVLFCTEPQVRWLEVFDVNWHRKHNYDIAKYKDQRSPCQLTTGPEMNIINYEIWNNLQ